MSAPGCSSVRVLLVEDHAMVAGALAAALRCDGLDVEVALGWEPAIRAGRRDLGGWVVLLDLDLGPGVDGAELIVPLRSAGARVVILSGSGDRLRLATCVERGAVGLVSKSAPLERLVAAVVQVSGDGRALGPNERASLLGELRTERADARQRLAPFAELTSREREVLRALIGGATADEIAEARCVSLGTVRSQVHAILTKLGVHSQQQAMAMAWQVRWPGAEPAGSGSADGRLPGPATGSPIYIPVDDDGPGAADPGWRRRVLASVPGCTASRSGGISRAGTANWAWSQPEPRRPTHIGRMVGGTR